TDETARRRVELKPHAPRAVIDHLRHLPFAPAQRFGHHTDELFWAINHHLLNRLVGHAVTHARDHFRLRDLSFITFAPHHLDQDRQLQFAAPRNFELIGRVGRFNADRDVAQHFTIKALAQLSRRDVLAFAPGERRIVDAEDHRDGRLIHRDDWQGVWIIRARDRLADLDLFDASERDDLADASALDRLALQTLEHIKLRDARLRLCAVAPDDGNRVARRDLT